MRITRRQGRGYKRQAGRSPQVIPSPAMERQATQPAAVPSGRKRRRVSSSKKPKGDKEDMKATRELEMALNRFTPSGRGGSSSASSPEPPSPPMES